jgi:hypothetical protein
MGLLMNTVNVKPEQPLILTSEVNIERIIANTYSSNAKNYFSILLLVMRGVEINEWPRNQSISLKQALDSVELKIIQSVGEFYLNQTNLNESKVNYALCLLFDFCILPDQLLH